MDSLELARLIAQEVDATKGKEIAILDLTRLVSYTDYFILTTASSDRHAQAIAEKVYQKIKKQFQRLPLSYEGEDRGQWVLLDYGDVVLHIFLPEQRQFYGLDLIWKDAKQIPISAESARLEKTVRKRKVSAGSSGRKSKAKPKKAAGVSRKR